MSAHELFKAGKLAEAVEAQTKEVKANPTDNGRRLFLFELLAFSGDLERAARQIDAVRYGDLERDATVQRYRQLIDSETARRATFNDRMAVSFLTEVPFHLRIRLDVARNFLPLHKVAEAQGLLQGAKQGTPHLKVAINGNLADGLLDADDLFGTALEVMTNGLYYWVPLEHVVSLAMNEPKFPRDLLWIPTRIELTDGQSGEVFLPALYPGSHLHPDDLVKLGRSTDWNALEDGPVLGIGRKTYLAGEEPIGILEWRELRVLGEIPAAEQSQAPAPELEPE
jgi:type VI secretion system protein ImpE